MQKNAPVLAWLDLEMTGLDPDHCGIVELALILTDASLEEIAPPLELVIWQPPAVIARMPPFVRQMHEGSGLLAKVERSEIDVKDAEHEVMGVLAKHAPYRQARLAGNSIAQDRRFLRRYMPAVDQYLHYRTVDVSTLKELAYWWNNYRHSKPKDGRHTAMADIRASIDELKAYRKHVWQAPPSV